MIATALGMSGCDESAKERKATPTPAQTTSGEPAKASQSGSATITWDPRPIEELAATVRQRNPLLVEEWSKALVQLEKRWSPVGKSVDEVKAMIGNPHSENAGYLGYHFPAVDINSWYQWSMSVDADVVKDAKFELIGE